MPCPLCRKQFTIPHEGLSGVQKNFWAESALRVRKADQEARGKTPYVLPQPVVGDRETATNLLVVTKEMLQRLETDQNNVIEHLSGVEDEINTTADEKVAAIQRDREKVLSEVGSIRLKRVKQLETARQDVEQHKTALESFIGDCETLLSSGTDVTRSANSLHDRAEELVKFDVIDHVDSSLPAVTFTSSTLLARDDKNLVGTVTEQGQLSQQ